MSEFGPRRRGGLAPARTDPFGEAEQMAGRMLHLLDQTVLGAGLDGQDERRPWSPLVEVRESDEAYVVEAELPGVRREDVRLEVAGDELVIEGERPERVGERRNGRRRRGRFASRVVLPRRVENEAVSAELKDGLLRVRVPKAERSTPRRIDVS